MKTYLFLKEEFDKIAEENRVITKIFLDRKISAVEWGTTIDANNKKMTYLNGLMMKSLNGKGD